MNDTIDDTIVLNFTFVNAREFTSKKTGEPIYKVTMFIGDSWLVNWVNEALFRELVEYVPGSQMIGTFSLNVFEGKAFLTLQNVTEQTK